jgi:hypothetical protein
MAKKINFTEEQLTKMEKELVNGRLHLRTVFYYKKQTVPPFTKYERKKFKCWTYAEEMMKKNELRNQGYNDFITRFHHPSNRPEGYVEPPSPKRYPKRDFTKKSV